MEGLALLSLKGVFHCVIAEEADVWFKSVHTMVVMFAWRVFVMVSHSYWLLLYNLFRLCSSPDHFVHGNGASFQRDFELFDKGDVRSKAVAHHLTVFTFPASNIFDSSGEEKWFFASFCWPAVVAIQQETSFFRLAKLVCAAVWVSVVFAAVAWAPAVHASCTVSNAPLA